MTISLAMLLHGGLSGHASHILTMRDHVSSEWQTAILICGKCSRRAKGGFGAKGRTRLAKALRAIGNRAKGRKADFGVVETGCLKICPKHAVVAIDASRPRDWLLIRPGTPVEEVAQRLGILGGTG